MKIAAIIFAVIYGLLTLALLRVESDHTKIMKDSEEEK